MRNNVEGTTVIDGSDRDDSKKATAVRHSEQEQARIDCVISHRRLLNEVEEGQSEFMTQKRLAKLKEEINSLESQVKKKENKNEQQCHST